MREYSCARTSFYHFDKRNAISCVRAQCETRCFFITCKTLWPYSIIVCGGGGPICLYARGSSCRVWRLSCESRKRKRPLTA